MTRLVHHYHFTVYALSVKSLGLPAGFDAEAALDAMKGKILAQGEELGLYTQNPGKGCEGIAITGRLCSSNRRTNRGRQCLPPSVVLSRKGSAWQPAT